MRTGWMADSGGLLVPAVLTVVGFLAMAAAMEQALTRPPAERLAERAAEKRTERMTEKVAEKTAEKAAEKVAEKTAVIVPPVAPVPAPPQPEPQKIETPAPAPAPPQLAAAPGPEPKPDCPPLFSLQFAAGEQQPQALSKDLLDDLSALRVWLEGHPRTTLLIQGHADALGSSRYNWELSYRRAHAVLQKLRQAGVPRERMVAQAVGAFQPLAGRNDTDKSNRRVTLSILELPQCAISQSERGP